jgi:hypothetical protein
MAEDKTEQVRENLKQFIALDDQERELRAQIKIIKDQKNKISADILGFMKENEVKLHSLPYYLKY